MTQNTNQNQRQKGMAHIGIVIAVVAVIAAVAFGGWWVWDKNNDTKNANTSQTDHAAEAEKIDEQKAVDVPEGWKFFRDDAAGFSFYYPPEWGDVLLAGEGGEKFYKFSKIEGVRFSAHSRDLEVSSLDFGVIAPAVIDVYLQDGTPAVKLASEFKAFRDFTNEHIVKKLNGNKICIAEDHRFSDYAGEDPFAAENPDPKDYTYFAYCGLTNDKYGAFVFSSGQTNANKPETKKLKEDTNRLLKTFEIF